MTDALGQYLDTQGDTVVDIQKNLVARVALGPENDGVGEGEKAAWVRKYLQKLGVSRITDIDAPDPRVPDGVRPNIAAVIPGKDASRTFWVISHLDVVPSGDRELWVSDPYTLRVEGDTLYGRGVEDNHQGVVSSLLVAKALLSKEIEPPMNYGMLFVADEETGSRYGLDHVVAHRPDLFGEDDLFLVPDFGAPDSSMVEVAEKHMLWLKIVVEGRQCHASTPDEGVNSLVGAAAFILKLRELYSIYDKRNPLFDPPISTFEPTRKDANVPNVNTVPGRDVFYVDCRILPDYDVDAILEKIREIGRSVARGYGVHIDYEIVQRSVAADPTPLTSDVVVRLLAAIKHVYGVTAKPQGIGGGTVAAVLRRKGRPTAVWATCVHNAHQPNERASIRTLINDAKVMAHVLGA